MLCKSVDVFGHPCYFRKGEKIPFEVADVSCDYHDDDEEATCIDVFPSDENKEGTVAALVYDDGRVLVLYDDALLHKNIMEIVYMLLHDIFK